MAQIDISDSAMAGVKLAVRRPLTVLVWGVLLVGYVVVLLTLFGGGIVAAITSLVRTPQSAATPGVILGLVGGLFGFIALMWLGLTVLGAVVMGAALRAELEPEKKSFASLRLGGQELWLIGVNFVLGVVIFVAQMVMGLPLAVITAAMAFATLGSTHGTGPNAIVGAMAGTVGIRIIGQLVIWAVTVWLWCRLCLGPVMSFRERQFRLFESWTITKGHAWPIFLSLLLVSLMLFALYMLVYILGGAAVIGTAFSIPGITDPQAFFSRPLGDWIGLFAPAAAFLAVLFVGVAGVANAMVWTTIARIYRQLDPSVDVAATFA